MSSAQPKIPKLETMPQWKEANSLAEYMYGMLAHFPREEEWHTRAKLHTAAVELMFWAGVALANVSPSGREYDWSSFRKHVGTVKTVYRFAGRQKFIELDPAVMVRLDTLLDQIDVRILQERARTEQYQQTEIEKDLQPWLEKYEVWKKLNGKAV